MIRLFTSKTQSFGEKGEKEAAIFLKRIGFTIVERNVGNKFGEIDIVAQRDKITYFFEVKTGKEGSSINPAENLNSTKIRKLLISAQHYSYVKGISNYRVQGIVVLILPNGAVRIELFDLL